MPTQTDIDQAVSQVSYYANLLIYQYITQPKAYATTFADVAPILMPQGYGIPLADQNPDLLTDKPGTQLLSFSNPYGPIPIGPILPIALQDAFTLGTAVGVQLNTVAEYIGGQRTNLQLNGTLLTFTDSQFTTYLTALASRNTIGSDLKSIEDFLTTYFPGEFTVVDYTHMRMSFTYRNPFGVDPIAEALITSGNLPVPMAVNATITYGPVVFNYFAFRTYNAVSQPGTSGYNTYSGSQTGRCLSYVNVVPVP